MSKSIAKQMQYLVTEYSHEQSLTPESVLASSEIDLVETICTLHGITLDSKSLSEAKMLIVNLKEAGL